MPVAEIWMWRLLFTVIVVGAAGGVAYLIERAWWLVGEIRYRFDEWLWEGYRVDEVLAGCDGSWVVEMLEAER